jgi:hypothetical protein
MSPDVATPSVADPIERRYLLLVYNPVLEEFGGETLVVHQGWNDPYDLVAEYAADVAAASNGVAVYTQADRIERDAYPVKADGFRYDDASYLACINDPSHTSCHYFESEWGRIEIIDYAAMLRDNNVCERFNAGEFDEVWLFGGPWMGFWEANQAGSDAIFTNGPVVTDSECLGRLNIMGFNYERGVAEMLEDLGHRTEGTLRSLDRSLAQRFALFTQYDQQNPGAAQCGNVHFAPNGESDYDWGNTREVQSNCDNWLHYPDLTGPTQTVTCDLWGCDARRYLVWWMSHLPHVAGETSDGVSNNWWSYILDRGDA